MKLSFANTALLILCFLVSGSATAADRFMTTAKGALYQDLKIGSGEVVEHGDVVTLHFTGWLDADGAKGKEIYNSRRERAPVAFVVGTDKVMEGWSEGVIGMKPGGKRLLMLPPSLAYGAKGVEGVVPPDAGMIFVIDLIEVEKSSNR